MVSRETHRDGKPYPLLVRMDSELHDQIKARAKAEERSMAQMIRYALKCYVASEPA
jgi:predicted HicB family RNase H-like nuclease